MDVEKIFHMKEGIGDASYGRNSSLQKKGLDTVKHMTIDTITDLYLTKTPHSMAIADLGCSSGPNTLSIIGELVGAVEEACRKTSQPTPEFRVFLNDLPTNDFNSVFIALPDLYTNLNKKRSRDSCSVFIAGVPGSFYGRLFPSNSLHFIHSSYSLHWLSKVPPALFDQEGKPINKGKMYISKTSPALVSKAYFNQFQEDFMWFLRSRSEEMVSGGRMVLILLGRRISDHTERGNLFFWDMLAKTFATMVSEGDIEEDKLDSYDVPFYAPSMDEIGGEVQREGSFTIDRMETFEIEGDGARDGKAVARAVRAIQESMIRHHFGEGIVDSLFERYAEILDEEMSKEVVKGISLIVVLRKSI